MHCASLLGTSIFLEPMKPYRIPTMAQSRLSNVRQIQCRFICIGTEITGFSTSVRQENMFLQTADVDIC